MTRTRLTPLALLAAGALVLTACAGAASGDGPPRIALIQGTATDSFYVTVACGAEAEARRLGVELDVQGAPTFDVATQTPILTSVIARNPDAIAIAPTDSTAMINPLRQAVDAGIEVVLFDTSLDDTSFVTASVTSDNTEGGREAARALAAQVGEQGKVVIIGGTPGVTTADQRIAGFTEQISTYPGITFLGVQPSAPGGGAAEAARLTTATLSANPDLAGVFAISTPAGDGANNAIRDSGKSGQVKIVGFDAGPAQVEQLETGLVQALVAQKAAEIGAIAVQQAVHAVTGDAPVTPMTVTDFVSLDATTAPGSEYVYRSSC